MEGAYLRNCKGSSVAAEKESREDKVREIECLENSRLVAQQTIWGIMAKIVVVFQKQFFPFLVVVDILAEPVVSQNKDYLEAMWPCE